MTTFSILRARLRLTGIQRLVRLPNLLLLGLCQWLVYRFLVPAQVRAVADPADIQLLMISTLLLAAAGYVINDYYDIKIDQINKPQRVVVGRYISRRKAILLHMTLSVAGVLIGLMLSWQIAVINAGAVLLLWGYSHTLKRTLLAGNIAIALLTTISILVVGYHFRTLTHLVYGYALFAFVLSLIREIIKDMEDLRGDAAFDCFTLPIALGLAGTKWVLYGLLLGYLVLLSVIGVVSTWPVRLFGFAFILLPSLYLGYGIMRADKKSDFKRLSTLAKLIMLAGILSMVLL